MFLFLLVSCLLEGKEEAPIPMATCNDDTIVTQIAQDLSPAQRDTASIIEEDFNSLQIPKNITAAAIVNAISESKLQTNAIGDKGASVGLFQLNKRGLGKKMTIEHRQDPHINAMVVGVQVLKSPRLLKREAAGDSIPELTAIFTEEIMRPKDREGKGQARKAMAKDIFPLQIPECEKI